jgi:pimeloyl-ACP methyl ester carboxylesterase
VLGWCNGARVAIDLTGRCPERISSLVLVAPTLRSKIETIEPKLCPFEIGLHPVLEAVAARPDLAPLLAQTISQQAQSPDWKSLEGNPARRAEALFRLPPKDLAPGLMAPLGRGDSLHTLARQVPSDEAYPIVDALAQVQTPIMLILGRHDQIVSNAFTLALMRRAKQPVAEAVIEGAGHYIHDLQYPYFQLALSAFVDGRDLPAAARVTLNAGAARREPARPRKPKGAMLDTEAGR